VSTETPDGRLVAYLEAARRILVFSGAGISTGSGIPDYRGPQGVWKRRQPVYYQDFMTSEEARLEYWDFQMEGWEGFRDARPNAAHEACLRLEREETGHPGHALHVARQALCIDARSGAQLLKEDLPAPGPYVPRRELALGGDPPRLALIHPEPLGLRLRVFVISSDQRRGQ